jgi:hypothetical protein
MELIILLIVAAVGIFFLYRIMFKDKPSSSAVALSTSTAPVEEASAPLVNKSGAVVDNPLDVNQDGKVDMKDAVEAVKKTRARAKKALDQDGDGKLTSKDVKVAASKVKAKGKEVAAKARGRKPASK